MKATINGMEVELSVQELLEYQKISSGNAGESVKKEEVKPKIVERVIVPKRTIRYSNQQKHWDKTSHDFLMANWINNGRGKPTKATIRNNNRIAKLLGRNYQACAQRSKIFKKKKIN